MVFPNPTGTWQTFVVKDQSVWHKINNDTPIEYAATITVNPLSALRMLEDFVSLNSGLLTSPVSYYSWIEHSHFTLISAI